MQSTEDIEMQEDYIADDEGETEHLEKTSNVHELESLRDEIDAMMEQGLSPPHAWYQKRYNNIQIYSELEWSSMAYRFQQTDRYIQNTALNIMNNIEDLLEEFHQAHHFNLKYYQHMVHDIEDLWTYYKTNYIGDESDLEVVDLIVGLTHMMSNL